MAADDQKDHGLMSLVDSINRALECDICLEEHKDLRTLTCCEKLVCLQCIEKLSNEEQQNARHDGIPTCPFCTSPLTKKPDEYAINKVVLHFQLYAQSLNKVAEKEGRDSCDSADCNRPVDKLCKTCNKFLCYRCSSEPCQTLTDEHDTVDVRDCVAESRESFNLWKIAKEKDIARWKEQEDATCTSIRTYAKQLVDASNDALSKLTKETVLLLSGAQKDLEEVNGKLAGEESALGFMVDTVKEIDDKELIHFMNQLKVYEEKREVVLGDYEALLNDMKCWDVTVTAAGHMLIAREGGLDVIDVKSKEMLKSVELELYAFTVEEYNNKIIIGVEVSATKTEMVILNDEYAELQRWTVHKKSLDFTAVDDKIFLTVVEDGKGDINTYSLNGERLPQADFLWNGSIEYVESALPCSLVFADVTGHKIYKKCVTSGKRRIEWSTPVKVPRCLCVDDNGLVWIRSNRNDCLTILKRDGTEHQEIMDDKLTQLRDINDICVHADHLYVAHETGVGRFPISYE